MTKEETKTILKDLSKLSFCIGEWFNSLPANDLACYLNNLYRAFTPVKQYLYKEIGGEDMTRIGYFDYVRQYCEGKTDKFKDKVRSGKVYDMGTRLREHITEEVYIDLDNRKEIVFGLDDDRLS